MNGPVVVQEPAAKTPATSPKKKPTPKPGKITLQFERTE